MNNAKGHGPSIPQNRQLGKPLEIGAHCGGTAAGGADYVEPSARDINNQITAPKPKLPSGSAARRHILFG